MPSRRWSYRTIAVICICSCSPAHRERPIAIKPAVRDSAEVSPVDGWLPHQVATAGQYVIQDSSTVSLVNDSAQSSSINSRTVFTLTTQRVGNSTVLQARVDSLSTTSSTSTAGPTPDNSQLPMFRAAMSSTNEVQEIDGPASTLCTGGQDPVVSRIFDLTVTYPQRRIKNGDKWADTIHITTCRGRTPLRQERTRQYEMLGRVSSPASLTVKIQRTTSTRLIGAGVSGQNRLNIDGSGTGSATLYVDETSGALLSAKSSSTSTLNVVSARGSYSFIQSLFTDIARR